MSDEVDSKETGEHPELERAYDRSEEARCPKTRRRTAGTATRSPDGMTPSRAANVTRPKEVSAGLDEVPSSSDVAAWSITRSSVAVSPPPTSALTIANLLPAPSLRQHFDFQTAMFRRAERWLEFAYAYSGWLGGQICS